MQPLDVQPRKRGKGTSRRALHAVAPRGRRCSHEARRRGGDATQEGGEQEAHSIRSEIDSGGRTKRDRDATAKDKVGTGGAAREECRELLAVGRPDPDQANWGRIWATRKERGRDRAALPMDGPIEDRTGRIEWKASSFGTWGTILVSGCRGKVIPLKFSDHELEWAFLIEV